MMRLAGKLWTNRLMIVASEYNPDMTDFTFEID